MRIVTLHSINVNHLHATSFEHVTHRILNYILIKSTREKSRISKKKYIFQIKSMPLFFFYNNPIRNAF